MSRWKIVGPWALILMFSLYPAIFAGCDDNPVDTETAAPEIETLKILCHDLSPSPGSIARLTVLVEGVSPENIWPSYTWETGGGSFPDGNTGISVEWLAPEESGIYPVSVRGSVDGVADTISTYVMVRNFEEMNTGLVYSCAPKIVSNIFYFLGGANGLSPRSTMFTGMHCYRYGSPGVSTLKSNTEEPEGGYDLSINHNGRTVTGSFITEYYINLDLQRLNVWTFPLFFGSGTNITDDGDGVGSRKNQHVNPRQNQSADNMVWEARIAGLADDGTEDFSYVRFWDKSTLQTVTVTESQDSVKIIIDVEQNRYYFLQRYYNNIKPMIVPDGDALIYFVDTTGVFEPCRMTIGDFPVVASRERMGNIFSDAGIRIGRGTVFSWNEQFGLLGFVSLGGKLCFLDYMSSSVIVVGGIEGVSGFAWSPDETECAVVGETGVWIVSAAGVVSNSPVYYLERLTDEIIGINWSPNSEDPKIAFRMVRKGKTVEDSYSALVLCMIDPETDEWINIYASPSINWSSSYETSPNYQYMQVLFTDDEQMYVPFPTPRWSGDPDRLVECAIFHSYD